MNRRRFLGALLAAPLAPVVAKAVPHTSAYAVLQRAATVIQTSPASYVGLPQACVAGWVSLVYGYPGSGKTLLALRNDASPELEANLMSDYWEDEDEA